MPNGGSKSSSSHVRTARLSRSQTSQKIEWWEDGNRSSRRFPYRGVIEFVPWVSPDAAPDVPDDEGYEAIVEPAPPLQQPRVGDWIVKLPKQASLKNISGKAHLVPQRLLLNNGSVFVYNANTDDSGRYPSNDRWEQVLPVDKNGHTLFSAVSHCNLSRAIKGDHGAMIAIQEVPQKPKSHPAARPDDASDATVSDNDLFEDSEESEDFDIQNHLPGDLDICVTYICGQHLLRLEPESDVFAMPGSADDGEDDKSGEDDSGEVVLSYLLKKFHVVDPEKRLEDLKAKFAEGLRHVNSAQSMRSGARKPPPNFGEVAGAWAMGVVEFFEGGAPSPDAGTTVGVSFAAFIAQMSETPIPEGWPDLPDDFEAPDSPVSDGFGMVSSPLDMACLLVAFGKACVDLHTISKDPNLSADERNKRAMMKLCDMGVYFGHMGVAGIGIADIAYNAYMTAEKAGTVGEAAIAELELVAEQTGNHLGVATGVVGVVVGTFVTIRNSRKAESARRRMNRVNALRAEAEVNLNRNRPTERAVLEHLHFAANKMRRKKFKHAFMATSAAIGATGSTGAIVVAAVGTVAAANAWNPIGWTIFAVGLGVGLGVTGYVLWRRFGIPGTRIGGKVRRMRKRDRQGKPVNSRHYAVALAQSYLDPSFRDRHPAAWKVTERQLLAIGIKPKKLDFSDADITSEVFRKLVSRIERKIK